jgi:hypothetical protein
MTMGPEILAWTGEDGLINSLQKISGGGACNWTGDQAVRRLAVTSISTFISGL